MQEAFNYLLVVGICFYPFVADNDIVAHVSLIQDIGHSWVKLYFKPTLRLKSNLKPAVRKTSQTNPIKPGNDISIIIYVHANSNSYTCG